MTLKVNVRLSGRFVLLVLLLSAAIVLSVRATPSQSETRSGQAIAVQVSPYEAQDFGQARLEIVFFRSEDGVRSRGILYLPPQGNASTVVVSAHPESDTSFDWRFPHFAKAGIAGLGIHHRYVRDDTHLIMEEVMLDIAAAVRYLRKERGFKNIILLGHSGGGSTMAFYQSQAEKRPPHRVSATGSGDPPNLNEYDLPPGDGLIVSAAHWGRGWTVLHRLDPSVADESDPVSVIPELDMYNPENGFREPPEPSKYSPEFVRKYEAAQEARMQRLVAQAREYVREQNMYREMMKDPNFHKRPVWERIMIQRRAVTERIMVIYRREASLKYTDLSLDPSDRVVGSNRGFKPHLQNYMGGFHPQPITPRAFLSSESTASNVFLLKDIETVTVPTLVICGTADRNEWPSEQKKIYEAAGARDKEIIWIEGADHPYLPSGPKAGKGDQREQTMRALISWIQKRYR